MRGEAQLAKAAFEFADGDETGSSKRQAWPSGH